MIIENQLLHGGVRFEGKYMTVLRDLYELTKLNSSRKTINVLGENQVYGFVWKDGIPISEINHFEQVHSINIPSDYKEFLTYSNGADIFLCDNGNSGYHLFSLEELISENEWIKVAYDLEKEDLVFMNMVYSADFLMFKTKKRKIIYCDTGEQNDSWLNLSMDFNYLILRLIWSNGRPFWEWCY